MNNYDDAVALVGAFSIIFMMIFAFNLTASPVFFLLCALMSFGYLLIILKKAPTYQHVLGWILLLLAIFICLRLPHPTGILF